MLQPWVGEVARKGKCCLRWRVGTEQTLAGGAARPRPRARPRAWAPAPAALRGLALGSLGNQRSQGAWRPSGPCILQGKGESALPCYRIRRDCMKRAWRAAWHRTERIPVPIGRPPQCHRLSAKPGSSSLSWGWGWGEKHEQFNVRVALLPPLFFFPYSCWLLCFFCRSPPPFFFFFLFLSLLPCNLRLTTPNPCRQCDLRLLPPSWLLI